MNQYRTQTEPSKFFDLDFVYDNDIARSMTNVVFEFRKAVEFEILIRFDAERQDKLQCLTFLSVNPWNMKRYFIALNITQFCV